MGDYFSAAEENCLRLLNISSSEKESLLIRMAEHALETAEKKQKPLTPKAASNLCSAGEDLVLIRSFQSYLEQKDAARIRVIFEYLCKKYSRYIYKIASVKLSGHSYCTPHEISQRVMIKLTHKQFRALSRFEGKSAFKTFLTTLIYRSISECLREDCRQKKLIDETDEADKKAVPDAQERSDVFHQHEEIQIFTKIVIDVIKEINEFWELKDVQMLFWRLQGMPVKQISEILHIGENTVSKKLTRKKGLLERFSLLVQGRLRRDCGLDIYDFDMAEIKKGNFWSQIVSSLPDSVRLTNKKADD
jgi:RNA polymerase sigma factor (sigma-70 family)